LINLYGRAVARGEVPKGLKHDHLSGNKGWFNCQVLRDGEGPLYVCEAALDALVLVASGCPHAIAIFGTHGWRWDWISGDIQEIVIATDADEGGLLTRQEIGDAARLRGLRVSYLDSEDYGGRKDAAAAFEAGVLRVGEPLRNAGGDSLETTAPPAPPRARTAPPSRSR
jgi:hypothetical protein